MNIYDRSRTDLPIVVHNTQPSEYEALVAEYKARGGRVTVVPEDTSHRNDPALSWASGRIYVHSGGDMSSDEAYSAEEGFGGWLPDLALDDPEDPNIEGGF